MSIRSDAEELQRQRDREIAIRKALQQMNGGSDDGLEPIEASEKGKLLGGEVTETCLGRQEPVTAETDLVLPPYRVETSPARVVGALERPWMRNGKLWRPQTSREREAEEMAAFDTRMLKQWSDHGLKEIRSYDEKILLDARQAKRMAREKRTGLRRLNGDKLADEHFISMEEAQSRGLLGGQGEDEE